MASKLVLPKLSNHAETNPAYLNHSVYENRFFFNENLEQRSVFMFMIGRVLKSCDRSPVPKHFKLFYKTIFEAFINSSNSSASINETTTS